MSVQTYRRALAAVYVGENDAAWLVAETPSEVTDLVRSAIDSRSLFVQLTLANYSTWNGKPLYLRPALVTAVSPPKDQDIEEDEEDDA